MKSRVSHIQFNIDPANVSFYKDLLTFMGWQTLYDADGALGVGGEGGLSLWFMPITEPVENHYDGAGMNHLGLGVASQAEVDAVAEYLAQRGVEHLFETPRHRPEFSESEDHTYYQVMFESPDRILIEAVYTGPKSA